MHDIYRTDKLLSDIGENYIICIAPINKWNLISRSDKVRLLVNQSISLIYLRFICFPSASNSQLVSRSLRHHLWTCLRRAGSFSRWQRRTMLLLFATRVQQGFREESLHILHKYEFIAYWYRNRAWEGLNYWYRLKFFISCIPSSIVMLWRDENTFYYEYFLFSLRTKSILVAS